ncbi:MAG: DUF411 domain-containing protein [Ignavibacteria bacterium]
MRTSTWIAALVLSVASLAAQAAATVEVFKNPSCGCCGYWVEYMKRNGFDVNIHDVADVNAVRAQYGMPQKYAACHTASVGGYVVEGHVPAADVRRLLAEMPRAIGIAVPSMPPGSPGMPSDRPVHFETLLVQQDGSYTTFAHH